IRAALDPPSPESPPGGKGEPVLTRESVAAALAALGGREGEPPQGKPAREEAGARPKDEPARQIEEAVEAIRKRKPEGEIAAAVRNTPDEALREALAEAERRADAVYKKGKRVETVLEHLDKLVDGQAAVARAFYRACGGLGPLLAAPDDGPPEA